MRKNLFLSILLLFTLLVGACSCDKFNIETYNTAVRNYNNATAIEYDLTVTRYTKGETSYILEESINKYELSTIREVINYGSSLKRYEITTSDYGPNGAPVSVYELNRYYKREANSFYTNTIVPGAINNKEITNESYDQKYDITSEYNINNIVPVFNEENISNFSIIKDESRKGYSIATFESKYPSYSNESTAIVTYTIYINKDFYFDKIEYAYESELEKVTYKYEFKNYNSDVVIEFPSDLN